MMLTLPFILFGGFVTIKGIKTFLIKSVAK
jgi:hypothetical protein